MKGRIPLGEYAPFLNMGYPDILIIKKKFTVDNIDYKKRWCTCGKQLIIPVNHDFKNNPQVTGENTNIYSTFIFCGNEIMRTRTGFEKGKGMHMVVGDYSGLLKAQI